MIKSDPRFKVMGSHNLYRTVLAQLASGSLNRRGYYWARILVNDARAEAERKVEA